MSLYFAYIIHFVISLLIGGLYCIGLWISRDGEMENMPNGDEKYKWRMIFYPFYRWLTKPYTEYLYYNEHDLKNLILDLHKWFPDKKVGYLIQTESRQDYKISDNQKQLWLEISCELEDKHCIKIKITEDNILTVWKQYERSREWTKPIIGCYKCYASFWGTIIFALTTLFAVRTNFIPLDFYILIPMWIIFCFSLVVINVLIEKITSDE